LQFLGGPLPVAMELSLKEPPANWIADVSRVTRNPDTWLVGAFLVLFGVAVAAAMPAIAGAVRNAMADAANSGHGKADTVQRVVVRARLAIRVGVPKPGGGHDLSAAVATVLPAVPGDTSVPPRLEDTRPRVFERGYHARAPPQLIA
jgi:hypothetical protein